MDDQAQRYAKMMELWRETALSLVQLATAALMLPTFFLREILGIPDAQPLNRSGCLLAAWAFLLLAIGAGTLYQITVARLIGDADSGTTTRPLYPQRQFWALGGALVAGIGSRPAASPVKPRAPA